MKPLWALLILMAAFGIVGRIDYEAAMSMASIEARP